MTGSSFKVVMLVDGGELSRIMYNALKGEFDIVHLVVEDDIPSLSLINRRIRRLGLLRTAGQILFVLFNRVIRWFSAQRIAIIKRSHGLDSTGYPADKVTTVESVNDEQVVEILHRIAPDAVVVNGTRIISERILAATDAVFLNTHVGITPRYRGVHGGYWALVSGDESHCGVTVHLVDAGIDTGGVLYQDTIEIGPDDNIDTYPFLQIAKAIPLMKRALRDVAQGTLTVRPGIGPSRLWSHPTLLEYLRNRAFRGVK